MPTLFYRTMLPASMSTDWPNTGRETATTQRVCWLPFSRILSQGVAFREWQTRIVNLAENTVWWISQINFSFFRNKRRRNDKNIQDYLSHKLEKLVQILKKSVEFYQGYNQYILKMAQIIQFYNQIKLTNVQKTVLKDKMYQLVFQITNFHKKYGKWLPSYDEATKIIDSFAKMRRIQIPDQMPEQDPDQIQLLRQLLPYFDLC